MRYCAFFTLACVACTRDESPPPEPQRPVIVYLVVDTLSASTARDTDFCGVVNEVAAAHGTDAACVDGAISPSSWTGEAHTRMLWPQHLVAQRRREANPDCDADSVFQTLSGALRASYVIGAQNGVIGQDSVETCQDGVNPWLRGADAVFRGDRQGDDQPVVEGIAELLAHTGAGEPGLAFLNSVRAGPHLPRCNDDEALSPACQGLYDLAVEYGLADASLPRSERAAWWGDGQHYFRFFVEVENRRDHERAAPFMHQSIHDRVADHQGEALRDRLEMLFSGLDGQGRLDDLLLVVTSDHGENPCIADPITRNVNCAHTGAPTEWTVNVPVSIVPAARAQQWQDARLIGDARTPWSTSALAWGLLDDAGVNPPDDWPLAPVPGIVTSWSCKPQSRHQDYGDRFAVHIVDGASLRCTQGDCAPYAWSVPTDPAAEPLRLDAVPDALLPYAGPPDWVTNACR